MPMETLAQPPMVAGSLRWKKIAPGVTINRNAWSLAAQEILSNEVLELIAELHRELEPERVRLLAERRARQVRWDAGELPGYLPADSEAVLGSWRVAPVPADLRRRRVEITGPVNNTKMVINMLSRSAEGARADTAMLDFEDSMKPSWANVVQGVRNVLGAVDRSLSFSQRAEAGVPEKVYRLDPEDMAKVMVRVRGLHLQEANLRVDDNVVAGGLLDFILCLWHTATLQVERGETPKYYVPKVESHQEARWWNRLFLLGQQAIGLPPGSLRATFLIETLPAAFEIEEILYEIREHAAGLNVGRWDKIFSDIKVLKNHGDRVLADRASIGLNRPWMRDYALRLVRICHQRGAFAMGGMAAFTPGRTPELRAAQTAKVVADKELEAAMGHDGCWVSHPYFIGPAMSAFKHDNQLDVLPEIDRYPDLLPVMTPPRTMQGLRTNVRVGIGYVQGWNQDIGCVAWDDLMEDLATLEISRAQIWQWMHHQVTLDDGPQVTPDLVRRIFAEESERIESEIRASSEGAPATATERLLESFRKARQDAEKLFVRDDFLPFLTRTSELV